MGDRDVKEKRWPGSGKERKTNIDLLFVCIVCAEAPEAARRHGRRHLAMKASPFNHPPPLIHRLRSQLKNNVFVFEPEVRGKSAEGPGLDADADSVQFGNVGKSNNLVSFCVNSSSLQNVQVRII